MPRMFPMHRCRSKLLSGVFSLFLPVFMVACTQVSEESFARVNGRVVPQALYEFLLGVRERDYMQAMTNEADDADTRHAFSSKVGRDLLLTEVLSQEAERLGIAESEKFQLEMTMARKTLLAQLMVQQWMRSVEVSEQELRRSYEKAAPEALYRLAIAGFDTVEQAVATKAALETMPSAEMDELASLGFRESSWLQVQDIAPELRESLQATESANFISEPLLRGGKWQLAVLLERQVFAKPPFVEQKEILEAEWRQRYVDSEMDRLMRTAQIKLTTQAKALDIDDAWQD